MSVKRTAILLVLLLLAGLTPRSDADPRANYDRSYVRRDGGPSLNPRHSRHEENPELAFDREKFRDSMYEVAKEKITEAVEARLQEIEGAARDAVHREINEIYKRILASSDMGVQLARFRGNAEAAVTDWLNNNPKIRMMVDLYRDKRSHEIIEGLGGQWEKAKGKLESLLAAKHEMEEAGPDADYTQILKKYGLSGKTIDRLEQREKMIRGALDRHSDKIEAFKILYEGFEGGQPGGQLIALFTLMETYGEKVPVLGAFIEAYGKLAKGMLEAALGVGRKIRERQQGMVGEGTTGARRDFYNTAEEMNARFAELFPGRTARPTSIKGVFVDDSDAALVYFWTGSDWIAGNRSGGGIGVVGEIVSFLEDAISPELAGRGRDIELLAKFYNCPGGFKTHFSSVEAALRKAHREVVGMARRFAGTPFSADTFYRHIESETMYRRSIGTGVRTRPFEEAIPDLAERYLYYRVMKPDSIDTVAWMKELPESIRKIRMFVINGKVITPDGDGGSLPVAGARVTASFSGARRFPGCSDRPADSDGRYWVVALLAAGGNSISVQAGADDLESEIKVVDDRVIGAYSANMEMRLTLELKVPTATLRVEASVKGTPEDKEDGTPVINLLKDGRSVGTSVGNEAEFTGLVPGNYSVRATADGYLPDSAVATLGPKDRESVSLSLEYIESGAGAWTISGICVDLGEAPVNATVTAGTHHVTTDGNGGFVVGPIADPTDGMTVAINASTENMKGSVSVAYDRRETSSTRIRMVGDVDISITGMVVDLDGKPIGSASVQAGSAGGGSWADGTFDISVTVKDGKGSWPVTVVVDADGGLVHGSGGTVTFKPGILTYDVGQIVVPVKQPIDVTVTGRVRDLNGVSIEGATVSCAGSSSASGADGSFAIGPIGLTTDMTIKAVASVAMPDGSSVASQPVSVPVTGPRLSGISLVVGVEQETEITISGRVLSDEGLGVPGASVKSASGSGSVTTDGSGSFTLPAFSGLLGKEYKVMAAYRFDDGTNVSGSSTVLPRTHGVSTVVRLAVTFQDEQDEQVDEDLPPGDDPGDLPPDVNRAVDDSDDSGPGDDGDPDPGSPPVSPGDMQAGEDPDDSPPVHNDDPAARAAQAAADARSQIGHNPAGALIDATFAEATGGVAGIVNSMIDILSGTSVRPEDGASRAELLEAFGAPQSAIDAVREQVNGIRDALISGARSDMGDFLTWWNGVLADRRQAEEEAARRRAEAAAAFWDALANTLSTVSQGGGQGTVDPNSGLSDVTVSSSTVTVTVHDHGQEDGDIINILHNGRAIKSGLRLTKSPQSFVVTLGFGRNTIEVQAVNEGSVSPNTATIAISDVVKGEPTQRYSLNQSTAGAFNMQLQR